MLPRVAIGRPSAAITTDVKQYRLLVGDELMDEVAALAKDLRNVRVCHINSTAYGGGVAELLSRYLPLLQGVGVSADWRLIHGESEFFTVTKLRPLTGLPSNQGEGGARSSWVWI